MRRGGLLAVHAHPDDETLSNGALLATWASAGRPVTVVTCTRGEAGEVIGDARASLEGDGPALAAHREAELAGALTALGVTDHLFLDQVAPSPDLPAPARGVPRRFVDSGMAWVGAGQAAAAERLPHGAFVSVDLDDAARRLADVILDRQPEVVVGYEPGGGYGHPDHVRAHAVMHRAVELAEARGTTAPMVPGPFTVPMVLWTVLDEASLRAAWRELADAGGAGGASRPGSPSLLTAPDPAGPVPSCAVPSTAVDVMVEVAPVLPRVRDALLAHATQVQAVRTHVPTAHRLGSYALSNGVLAPLLRHETYRSAPGGPGRTVVWPEGVTQVA
ncbi:PIG-L family deacetylase [Actinotalea sp. K2]|uniref:PIG-L family deacetylase n=1 Tax=Actinotalea sp. K2 TaxID=2939438 RepID=UPI002016CAD0|nr:PIG-L family deacetylase [Actinotalea sp. K2]MCL3862590.1 PIG-L family deacetylase [Actinotalea sp. K2]